MYSSAEPLGTYAFQLSLGVGGRVFINPWTGVFVLPSGLNALSEIPCQADVRRSLSRITDAVFRVLKSTLSETLDTEFIWSSTDEKTGLYPMSRSRVQIGINSNHSAVTECKWRSIH
jgi:hypothetical protein